MCLLVCVTACATERHLHVVTDYPQKERALILFNKVYHAADVWPLYKVGVARTPTIGIWNLEHEMMLITSTFLEQASDEVILCAFAHELAHDLLQHGAKGGLALELKHLGEWSTDATKYTVSGAGWGETHFVRRAVGGYTKEQEIEADQQAVMLIETLGLTRDDYIGFLEFIEQNKERCEKDYLFMHPELSERIALLKGAPVGSYGGPAPAGSPVLSAEEIRAQWSHAQMPPPTLPGQAAPYQQYQSIYPSVVPPVMQAPGILEPVLPESRWSEPLTTLPPVPLPEIEVPYTASVTPRFKEEVRAVNGRERREPAEQRGFTYEIVSGQSALGVTLGGTYGQLCERFGEPQYKRGNIAVYTNRYNERVLEIFFNNTNFEAANTIKTIRIYPLNLPRPAVIDSAVSTDRNKQELLNALGTPEGFRLNEWSYYRRGLHMHFEAGKIDKIQISPPA